jgi:hypothetical protein
MLSLLLSALLLQTPVARTAPDHAAHIDCSTMRLGFVGELAPRARPVAPTPVPRDGRALRSAGHDHGPQCSGVRKIVDFALQPGRYTITFGRAQGDTLRLLVIRR